MEYEEFAPAPALRSLVRCYWRLLGHSAKDAPPDPALPDGSPELIFNLADPFEQVSSGGAVIRQPPAFLVGQITRPIVVRPTGRVDLVAVRFEAHGAALIHGDLSRLRDRWVDVAALRVPGLHHIASDLAAAPSTGNRRVVIDRALAEIAKLGPTPDPRVAAAVLAIRVSEGAAKQEDVARDVRLTARTLQRLFSKQVGISPKLLARIVRFQRVFATVRDDPGNLARVAARCGYFDQAHLARDFRQFAGSAPAALLAALPEFTGFFLRVSLDSRGDQCSRT